MNNRVMSYNNTVSEHFQNWVVTIATLCMGERENCAIKILKST